MQTVVDVILKTQGDNNIRKLNRELATTTTVSKKAVGQLTTTSKAYTKTGVAAKGASKGVSLFGKALNTALGPIGAALAAIGGLAAAFQTISNQDFAVAKVKSLGVNAGELNAELKQVSGELNNSASVAELTASAYDVASAGFTDAADAAQVLKAASMGATGGFTDMNTAGDALTSVLNAYGMSADQATATMDKFIATQNDGKIVVDQYARNIGKVASAAASLGVPLDEVNAIIAQSTAAGVNAEVAFTGLKSAIARLASGEANKALEEYGVSISAASIESDGLAGSLQKIVDAGVDTGTLLKALGNEAGPALLPVLNNLDKFNELLDNQKNSAGAAAKANKLATDTIKGAWKQLNNVFSNFFTEQTAAGDLLKLTLQGLTVVIQGILNAVNLALTPFKVLVGIINGLKQITDTLGASFAAAFDSPEGRAFLEVVGLIQQKIGELTQWIAGGFTAAWNGVLWVVKQIGSFIGTVLVTAIDGVVKGLSVTLGWLPKIGGQIKKAEKEWNALKESVESTTQPLADAATSTAEIDEKTQSAKLSADQLAEAQKGVAAAIQEANAEVDKQIQAQQSIAELQTTLAQERLKTEMQVNKVLLEQAKAQLDNAKGAAQRQHAAKKIYELTIQQAKLELEKANLAIDMELNKVRLQREKMVLRQKEVELIAKVAEAEGRLNEYHLQALQLAEAAVVVANEQYKIAKKIAIEQKKQASAVYESAMVAAKAAYQQNRVWKNTEGAAAAAGKFASNMERGAAAASKAASATSKAGGGGGSSTTTINLPREIMDQMLGPSHQGFKNIFELEEYFQRQTEAINAGNKALKDQAKYDSYKTKAAEYAAVGAEHAAQIYNDAARIMESTIPSLQRAARTINSGDRYANQRGAALPQYGSGGYVNDKQTAVIGEAGPEYVIPANRMDTALSNYASGKRGNAVLSQQVNVTTGPVQQMDGTNYVTLQQATSMSQSAARQGAQMALTQIKTDPGTRRSIGVGS